MIKMTKFIDKVKELFFKGKGVDIEDLDYVEMPKSKDNYDVSKAIGNVNLIEGRFRIKSEAIVVIDKFLVTPLP
jgi:hypothetical protein